MSSISNDTSHSTIMGCRVRSWVQVIRCMCNFLIKKGSLVGLTLSILVAWSILLSLLSMKLIASEETG